MPAGQELNERELLTCDEHLRAGEVSRATGIPFHVVLGYDEESLSYIIKRFNKKVRAAAAEQERQARLNKHLRG